MHSAVYIILAIQLSLSLVVAQITFTREWVNGKRTSLGSSFSLQNNQEHPQCKSLWPAIEILMETEKLQRAHCGIHLKAAKYLAHLKAALPRGVIKQEEDEPVQFDEDSTTKNP